MARKIKPIFDTLQTIRHGELLEEASDELNKLVEAIKQTRKGGSLILTLKIDPLKGDVDKVLIKGMVKTKLPEEEPAADFMYTTDENNLSLRNPRQQEMKLHAAGEDKTITFDPETGEELAAQN